MNAPVSTPLVAIGIDFGGTSIKLAVIRGGEILERGRSLDTQALGSPQAICDAMTGEIQRLRETHPEVVGIGVGMPGMIDAENGIVHGLSNVPGWDNFPLRDVLHKATGLPVAIDNDAKAMAYGEWRYGAANNQPNVICVTLGTGVGGGLILGGKLYRGSFNGAGEIGQTSIDYKGVPAVYGNCGAVEKYVGNQQITERAHARYAERGAPRPIEECTPAALSKAAAAGDPIALELWNEFGTELGAALANLVWLLNPDCIVLGGGVAKAGEVLFKPIRKSIESRTMRIYTQNLDIVPATLGADAGAIGAAALITDQIAAAKA